ncbi:uncharacterized protein V6R79_004033 [Siganus canaliculatus]
MKCSALLILMLNNFCVFSQSSHDILYFFGCFTNGSTEVQFEFDSQEVLYVDFQTREIVYNVPRFFCNDPSLLTLGLSLLSDALENKGLCSALTTVLAKEGESPEEETAPPDSILYTSEDVQLGVENSLICFVNHFYPPGIKLSWTKNGYPVTVDVSLSRYYPNNDQTFHQFSTLTFIPTEGDIYSCTVEHLALDEPLTRIWAWEPEVSHVSLGPDIFCGVGFALALVGVAVGTFFFVKGYHCESMHL